MSEIPVRTKAIEESAEIYILENGTVLSTIDFAEIYSDAFAGLTLQDDDWYYSKNAKYYPDSQAGNFCWRASYPAQGELIAALGGCLWTKVGIGIVFMNPI